MLNANAPVFVPRSHSYDSSSGDEKHEESYAAFEGFYDEVRGASV